MAINRQHQLILAGYTLIELTIVVGLIAILAIGISSVVLMNTLTASRTRNLTHLRSSGDYSLNQLKTLVRNARSIDSCSSTTNTFSFTSYDGGTTLVALELDGTTGRIASGSGTYLTPDSVHVENFSVTCLPTSLDPKSIKLTFDSSIAGLSPGRENPIIPFETSITLRNN